MVTLKVPNALIIGKQSLVSITFFFLPLLFFDSGFSGLQTGIIISSITFTGLLSGLPTGIINDKLSIRYVAVAGMLLESLMFLGLYAFSDFLPVLAFIVAGSLGGNMIDTSIRGLTLKVTERRVRGMRLGRFQASNSIGAGIGTAAGGLLLFLFNFKPVLLISSAAFVVMAIASFLVTETEKARFPVRDYASVFMKKETALFLIPLFIFGSHWGAEHTSYALFLRQNLGLDMLGSGIYMGIPIIILGIASLLTGRYIDSKGTSRSTFFIGMLLSGAGHILMTVPALPLSFFFRVLHEIGDGMTFVSYYVGFSRIFRTSMISGEAGAAASLMLLGSAAASLVFGPIGYAYGFQWPLIISGIMSIAAVILMRPVRSHLKF